MAKRDRRGRWRDAAGRFLPPPDLTSVADALAESIDPSWTGYDLASGDSEAGPRDDVGKHSQGQAFRSLGAEGDGVTGAALARGLKRFKRRSESTEIKRAAFVQIAARYEEPDGERKWTSLSFAEGGRFALDHAIGEAEDLDDSYLYRKQGGAVGGVVGIEIRTFEPGPLAPSERVPSKKRKKGNKGWTRSKGSSGGVRKKGAGTRKKGAGKSGAKKAGTPTSSRRSGGRAPAASGSTRFSRSPSAKRPPSGTRSARSFGDSRRSTRKKPPSSKSRTPRSTPRLKPRNVKVRKR